MLKQFKSLVFGNKKVPNYFKRMIQSEYRMITIEFVEDFLQKNDRLPTVEELNHYVR